VVVSVFVDRCGPLLFLPTTLSLSDALQHYASTRIQNALYFSLLLVIRDTPTTEAGASTLEDPRAAMFAVIRHSYLHLESSLGRISYMHWGPKGTNVTLRCFSRHPFAFPLKALYVTSM